MFHHAHHLLAYGCGDAFLLRFLLGAIVLSALFTRARGVQS